MVISKQSSLIFYSLLLVAICFLITISYINPIWQKLEMHVPGEPGNRVDYTQPVDTIFYIRDAANGYVWNLDSPTSLWFHPLLIWIIAYTPQIVPLNHKMLVISLVSGVLSAFLNYRLIKNIFPTPIPSWMLLFIIFIPGFMGISTGNAEIPCLLLTTLLMLSVLEKWNKVMPFLLGSLAILCKPNAMYMVPVLSVYLIYGGISKDKSLVKNTIMGIMGIIVTWCFWIFFVDYKVGQVGAYWFIRDIGSVPLTAGPLSLLQRTVRSIVFYNDHGEILKYITALSIPIIDMLILLVIPFSKEQHRMAFFSGFFAILFVTFAINNPNKVIVYATTLPCHLIVGLLFIKQTLFENESKKIISIVKKLSGISYICFGFVMIVFYILGTPLGWYY
jgi:hypothetical protein